ncbi:hemolysin III family protein [Solihabitans fulvus]|uniref:Hemolysin III family protein n=1 Tax=Solihabitans fulvus TaxID=1892852 RepID=A0A5B2WSS6_9PSEU|nr:hemolysin III family protein [Solihabitans fulvus]KAA2253934.1 hemolysin III family protein [Solihabitans fulvus]
MTISTGARSEDAPPLPAGTQRRADTGDHLVDPVRPRLRGWLHAAATPLTFVAATVLLAAARTPAGVLAALVYSATSLLLFAVSATYHLGRWPSRMRDLLARWDHANIYLIIAGTYTPLALLALHGSTQLWALLLAWGGAAAGVVFRLRWLSAPRWLCTGLYLALGWVAVFFLPEAGHAAGLGPVALIMGGGLLYTVGGVVYGLRRPDPWPRWFGYHEVFHACTIAAYAAQYAGILLITTRMG